MMTARRLLIKMEFSVDFDFQIKGSKIQRENHCMNFLCEGNWTNNRTIEWIERWTQTQCHNTKCIQLIQFEFRIMLNCFVLWLFSPIKKWFTQHMYVKAVRCIHNRIEIHWKLILNWISTHSRQKPNTSKTENLYTNVEKYSLISPCEYRERTPTNVTGGDDCLAHYYYVNK